DRERAVREGPASCSPAGVPLAEARRQAVYRPRLLRQRTSRGDLLAEVVLQAAVALGRHAVSEEPRPGRSAATWLWHPCTRPLRRRRRPGAHDDEAGRGED